MADGRLAGDVVLVTGGTTGLGLVIARSLAQAGAAVAVHGRDQSGIDAAVTALRTAAAHLGLPQPSPQAALGEALQFWVRGWRHTYN